MKQDFEMRLTDVRVARILALIAQLRTELGDLAQLDKKERRAKNAVSVGRLPFTEAATEVGQSHGDEINLSPDEQAVIARMSYEHKSMRKILKELKYVFEGVSDTTLLLGSNLYEFGLIVRDLVEVAIRRGVPGMESYYDDLSYLWENRGGTKDEDEPDGGAEEIPKP